jgi:hypothetical protein
VAETRSISFENGSARQREEIHAIQPVVDPCCGILRCRHRCRNGGSARAADRCRPQSSSRNNATRALLVIATLAERAPVRRLRIPPQPFIDLLNSLVWTDRNKSAGALEQLTASRDPALLSALRARALPSLIEMARWQSPAHAASSITIVGRIGGLSEEEIQSAQQRGDADRVIAAATRP